MKSRIDNSSLTPAQCAALKSAFRRLTKAAGGQESAASITRVDHQRIGRYGRVQDAPQAPIDVVADLEMDTGQPLVTAALAAMTGHVLITKPVVSGSAVGNRHLVRLAKEAGELIALLADALGDDGRVSASEIVHHNLRGEITDLMVVLATIDGGLAAIEAAAARAGEVEE